ncbi:MAG TPA: outer membrane protein transport protein, partial [Thiolinea sp.]|nr:outer membrane protein transport protein [Thiolinea sp.]
SIAYEVNDKLTLGGGLSAQYITVELGSAIDSSAACRSIAGAANSGDLLLTCLKALPTLGNAKTDSKVVISGDDVSLGFNLGAMYKPSANTKIGMSYRSGMKHKLDGKADYTVNAALQPILNATGVTRFNDVDVKAEANLPDTLSLSVAHKANDKLELLGDVTQTGWSSFERLRVTNKATGAVVTNVEEKWKNVTRFSVGANYQYNDRIKLRGGLALDKTPVPDEKYRTPRTPDTDRTWLAAGMNYKLNKASSLDLGYAHLFMDKTPIDNTSEDNGYAVRGVYDSSVDIISAQYNMSF